MLALRCAVGLALMLSVAGCSRAGAPPTARPISHKRARSRPPHANEKACVAMYRNKCFDSADQACAFAGCADQRCDVIETVPARVSCDDMR